MNGCDLQDCSRRSEAMATAREYQSSKERCERRAKLASNEQVEQAWLNLAESYQTLLTLEQIEIVGVKIKGKRAGQRSYPPDQKP
jgi:hypothetical protein